MVMISPSGEIRLKKIMYENIITEKGINMKKIFCCLCLLFLCGCAEYTIVSDYKLEKWEDSEVPVCVSYPRRVKIERKAFEEVDACGNVVTPSVEYKDTGELCDVFEPEVVSYNYCLSRLAKPVHLVEKKVNDMTICYDRNNKIDLPILYCQKDMINIQTVDVQTNVVQKTKVNNKTIFNF